MALFNKRILKKIIGDGQVVPSEHLVLFSHWAENVKKQKEVAVQGDFKARIIENILGYCGVSANAQQTIAAEYKIGSGEVDLALGYFGREGKSDNVFAPFELKGAKTHNLDAPISGRKETPVEQAWRYGRQNIGTKWVLVSNMVEIRLYNYAHGEQNYEVFFIKDLCDPFEYARFQLLLSANNLLGGKTEGILFESARADEEIGDNLYRDYKELRQQLIAQIPISNANIDAIAAVGMAQKTLDRVLFIAFAEDCALLPARSLEKAFEHNDPYNPRPVWQNFAGLFSAIDKGNKALKIPKYNGGLFAPDKLLDGISLPDEICEGFKKIGAYDFESEISVTILGHIFEQSVSDLERLLARARGEEEEIKSSGTSGRRKRDGIVYTPDYIANFIVKKTLGTHVDELFFSIMAKYAKGDANDYEKLKFSKNGNKEGKAWKKNEIEAWLDYRSKLQNLRVVDPACGSGVFLVAAFDYLKTEYDKVNAKMEELREAPDLFDPDNEILAHNLYGVDVNAESVEISRLSLWLKTAKYGKELASLDHTIRVGDSLIEDSNFAYLEHNFNWHKAFPEVFANGGFDVVLGNPPYVRMELIKLMKPYLEKRFEVASDRADLYCYFFERGLRLLKPNGRLGYISSSTFFKTNSGKPLRKYLLKQAIIETITDFGDLQIFGGVTTYPAILTMRRGKAQENHNLRFWKLNALPDDNFNKAFGEKSEGYLQTALGSTSWELESPNLRALRQKIIADKPTLKQVYGSPLRGIVTGLNEAFIIDRKTRDMLIKKDVKSASILKSLLKGSEIKRWRAEPRDLWIIYIPKNRINIDDFPAIKEHLTKFRESLRKRATKQEWFELQQAQETYQSYFEKPKVAYNRFLSSPAFWLDYNGSLINDAPYFIPNGDLFLCSLLNSSFGWFWFTATATKLRGGFFQLLAIHVENLPIPPATTKQKAALAELAKTCQNAAEERYRLQQGVRQRIPDLCPPEREPKLNTKLKNWWEFEDFSSFRIEIKKHYKAEIPLNERSDWENWLNIEKEKINLLSAKISQTEAMINQKTYQLFDLTNEEIKLLEDNI